ncbi:MAG: hypothetical protein AAGB11_09010 [Pseudomonadota bacterium]
MKTSLLAIALVAVLAAALFARSVGSPVLFVDIRTAQDIAMLDGVLRQAADDWGALAGGEMMVMNPDRVQIILPAENLAEAHVSADKIRDQLQSAGLSERLVIVSERTRNAIPTSVAGLATIGLLGMAIVALIRSASYRPGARERRSGGVRWVPRT